MKKEKPGARTPGHDETTDSDRTTAEAERAVLGSIMLDPAALSFVVPVLSPEDFSSDRNERIFRAMLALSERSGVIDIIPLKEELNAGTAETVDAAYLSALMDGVPDIGNVAHYARIVKDKAARRRRVRAAEKLVHAERAEDDNAATRARGELDAAITPASETGGLPRGWLRAGDVLQASPLPKARFKTGIPALDEASRGGLPTGAVIVFQGEPDAGKTGLGLQIALKIAIDQDVVVVIYAPDGGRENAEIRLGALLGFDAQKLEERNPDALEALREKLADRRMYFPDHSREDTTFASIVAEGRKIEPGLPHIYLVDSIQECRATEDSDELDERRRVVEIMRGMQKAATDAVPTLCFGCGQTNTASFASRKPKDRTRPIAAGAESGKIAFLSSLIVHLDGDPGKAPDFGRAQIVKSKLGGPKRTFGLKLDARTTELQEIDAATVEQERTEQREREETDNLGRLGERALQVLLAHGRLSVSQLHSRVGGRRADLLDALNGLEAQGAAGWKAGPRGARLWEAVRRG